MRYLLLFLLLLSTGIKGQNINFKSITTSSGLSNNSINCMENSPTGELWIGTWDGLTVYDGKKFAIYKHAKDGNQSLAGNNVFSILQDKDQQMWVMTDARYLGRYLGEGLFDNYLLEDYPIAMHLNKKGTLEVLLKNGKSFQAAVVQGQTIVTELANYQLDSLYTSDEQKAIQSLYKRLQMEEEVNAILRKGDQEYWIATRTKGLHIVGIDSIKGQQHQARIVGKIASDVYAPYGLKSNEISILHQDIYGYTWLGLKDGGVAMILDEKNSIDGVYPHYVNQPYLPMETVRALTKDLQERHWVGYYTEGLFVREQGQKQYKAFELYKAKEDKDWKRIRSLFTDSRGSVWVGTYAGVVRIDGQKQTYYSKSTTPFLSADRTYAFAQEDQTLWLGSWGGVSKYNMHRQAFESFYGQDKLEQYHIRAINVVDDLLYIATELHGLIIFDSQTGQLKNIDEKTGLIGNSVYDIYIDNYSGELWVATLGGISIFDRDFNLINTITEQEGLPSHLVYSLNVLDSYVWISTTKGVAAIDKVTKQITNYSQYIGWQGLEFAEGAHYKDEATGNIVLAGYKGINFFNPNDLLKQRPSPFFKLWINQQLVDLEQELSFAASDNNLVIEIYPVGFVDYPVNQYQYRIIGLFDDWRVLPTEPVKLDNLAWEDYSFEIRNALDKEKPIVYQRSFMVHKPWYLNTLLWVGFIALVLIAIYFKLRQRKIAQQKKELYLTNQVKLRTQEIQQQQQSLLQQNKQLNELHQEVLDQKQELLRVHSKLKNGDIEIEKLRLFLLSKMKKPLITILENIGDAVEHQEIKNELVGLYDMVREWNYLEQIREIDTKGNINVNLAQYTHRLIDQWILMSRRYEVSLKVDNQLSEQWGSIDAMRIKILFQYLFSECFKFMGENQRLDALVDSRESVLRLVLSSESTSLQAYWEENKKYSPYLRAVSYLIKELGATMHNTSEHKAFELSIDIPVLQETQHDGPTAGWTDLLEDLEVLPKDKLNVLAYAQRGDAVILNQLFTGHELCHLVHTDKVNKVISYLDHYQFNALILYDNLLSDEMIQLLKRVQKQINKQRLLVFYFSEEVDYFLQEQMFQLGVTDLVYLPVNDTLLETKVIKRIAFDKQNKASVSVIDKITSVNQSESVKLSSDEKLLRKAISAMEENYTSADFSVEQLASDLGLSKIKLYRLYKDILEVSPIEVLIEMRMKKAKHLVEQANLSIGEISYECGYNDPKHFSKTFKKYHGDSPSAYQKNRQMG
ncbi:helix-turn-helix domain-containing protein [Myroides pelagicus]|nr:helix-turn-helix domain-containing protein [Myroides pelagicus]